MLYIIRGGRMPCVFLKFQSNAGCPIRTLCVCIIFFLVTAVAYAEQASAAEPQDAVNCNVHSGACIQKISDTRVTLDISPKPVKAMADLRFRLTLDGKQPPETPFIDLGMPGMKMGPNRVDLKSSGKGVYGGTGVIVRCPSGKRIWKATVTVPEIGAAEFIFDVIY